MKSLMIPAALILGVMLLSACASGEPMTAEQRMIWAQAVMNGGAAMQQAMVARPLTTCYSYGGLGVVQCR